MRENKQFYIDGKWVAPSSSRAYMVINPATEEPAGVISLGSRVDVDLAVAAARRAFDAFSRTSAQERLALLEQVLSVYMKRWRDIGEAIQDEMGAPRKLAQGDQTAVGEGHLSTTIEALRDFQFEETRKGFRLSLEPVGVCALITPWNWPINQIAAKVVPALAAGCTMVLKPSEFAPFSAAIWAEVLHEAGVPPGVFNLVNGSGVEVGAALASHSDVDLVSFTGSTRAGAEVARAAAETVKRVHQELGGKSPNILLEDVDFGQAVKSSVQQLLVNSGQSCDAPTRMLVPASRLVEVETIAKEACESTVVGDPRAETTTMGPVISEIQFNRIQSYIQRGIAEGATLVTGGGGRPAGLATGYYVKPTVFSAVRNDMVIAREEIFGPVLCILPYETEDQAVQMANDTPYGLAAYVWSKDLPRAARVARRLRAGQVSINGAMGAIGIPFGGFKRSGNGREGGEHGLRDFLEVKAIIGEAVA